MRRALRVGNIPLWEDPKAKPGDLWLEIGEDPRVLRNPNMPPQQLVKYAYSFPQHVERNPALDLIALENPAAAKELYSELLNGWIFVVWKDFDKETQGKLAIAQAYFALEIYEELTEGDETARRLLNVAYDFLRGKTTKKKLGREIDKASEFIARRYSPDSYLTHSDNVIVSAIGAAIEAANIVWMGAINSDEARPPIIDAADAISGYLLGDDARSEDLKKEREKHLKKAADLVRQEYAKKERQRMYNNVLDQIENNEAAKQAQLARLEDARAAIKAATDQAQKDAKKIAKIMQEEETTNWPLWIGLGIAGGVAVLTLGPGLLTYVAAAGARAAVSEIVTVAAATGVQRVSVSAFIAGTAEISSAETAVFLRELITKLNAKNIKVVEEAVQAAVKVAR